MCFRLFPVAFLLFILQIRLITAQEYSSEKSISFEKRFNISEETPYDEDFQAAISLYEKSLNRQPDNPDINFKLGISYLYTNTEKQKAVKYLEHALQLWEQQDANDSILFHARFTLAKAYHLNNKFQQAIQLLEKLQNIPETEAQKSRQITRYLQLCHNGLELIKSPVDVTINNIGKPVNSIYSDHSPILSADRTTMVFTSNRIVNESDRNNDSFDSNFEDIFITNKKNGKWTNPQPISIMINTKGNEAACSLSPDGTQLIIYKGGNIYASHIVSNEWSYPEKIDYPVSSDANETHAAISANGRELFFTSNRKGGFGGLDIYIAEIQPDGSWGNIRNAGKNINTQYDEETPYIHPDRKTLYFSSKGHNSMGGFDIFVSQRNAQGEFEKPLNIGYPLNTTADDVFFVPAIDGLEGYYSSRHGNTLGKSDIFQVVFHSNKEKNIALITGTLLSKDTKKLLYNPMITIRDFSTQKIVDQYMPNPQNGKFQLVVPTGKKYNLQFSANDHFFHSTVIPIPDKNSFVEIKENIALYPIHIGSTRKTYNTDIKGSNLDILTKQLSEFLNNYKELFVDISFKSDNAEDNQSIYKRIENKMIENKLGKQQITTGLFEKQIPPNLLQFTVLDKITKAYYEAPWRKAYAYQPVIDSVVLGTTFKTLKFKIFEQDDNRITPAADSILYNVSRFLNKNKELYVDISTSQSLDNGHLPEVKLMTVIDYLIREDVPRQRILTNHATTTIKGNEIALLFLDKYTIAKAEKHKEAYLRATDFTLDSLKDGSKQSFQFAIYDEANAQTVSETAKLLLSKITQYVRNNDSLYIDITTSKSLTHEHLPEQKIMAVLEYLINNGIPSKRISTYLSGNTIRGNNIELTIFNTESKEIAQQTRDNLMKTADHLIDSISSGDAKSYQFDIYDSKKTTDISIDAKLILDHIVRYLKDNDSLYVDITTSKSVQKEYLPEQKLMPVIEYLLANGVAHKRILTYTSTNELEDNSIEISVLSPPERDKALEHKLASVEANDIILDSLALNSEKQTYRFELFQAQTDEMTKEAHALLKELSKFLKKNTYYNVQITTSQIPDENYPQEMKLMTIIEYLLNAGVVRKRISTDPIPNSLKGNTVVLTITKDKNAPILAKSIEKERKGFLTALAAKLTTKIVKTDKKQLTDSIAVNTKTLQDTTSNADDILVINQDDVDDYKNTEINDKQVAENEISENTDTVETTTTVTNKTNVKTNNTNVGETTDDVVTVKNMLFAINQAIVKDQENLNKLADYLKKNPTAKVEIGGFADSQGNVRYNQYIAGKRAEAVKQYLLNKNVKPDQFVTKNYGISHQIAQNRTSTGGFNWQALKYNRRVEFKVLKPGVQKLAVLPIQVPEEFKADTTTTDSGAAVQQIDVEVTKIEESDVQKEKSTENHTFVDPKSKPDTEAIVTKKDITGTYSLFLVSSGIPLRIKDFSNIDTLQIREIKTQNDQYRYFYGSYKTSQKAEEELEKIRENYPHAFIFIND